MCLVYLCSILLILIDKLCLANSFFFANTNKILYSIYPFWGVRVVRGEGHRGCCFTWSFLIKQPQGMSDVKTPSFRWKKRKGEGGHKMDVYCVECAKALCKKKLVSFHLVCQKTFCVSKVGCLLHRSICFVGKPTGS